MAKFPGPGVHSPNFICDSDKDFTDVGTERSLQGTNNAKNMTEEKLRSMASRTMAGHDSMAIAGGVGGAAALLALAKTGMQASGGSSSSILGPRGCSIMTWGRC